MASQTNIIAEIRATSIIFIVLAFSLKHHYAHNLIELLAWLWTQCCFNSAGGRRWCNFAPIQLCLESVFASVCMRVHLCVSEHALLINRPQEAVIYFLTFSSKFLRRLFTILVLHTELCVSFLHVRVCVCVCECVFVSVCICFFIAWGETGKLTFVQTGLNTHEA